MAKMDNQPGQCDVVYKVLIVGDPGVGKSSLILRYSDGIFTGDIGSQGIGDDFKIITVETEGKTIKLMILDIVKEERCRTSSGRIYTGSDAFIIVFDLTNEDSLHNIPYWVDEIDRYVSIADSASLLLVGNKADLISEHVVDHENAKAMAMNYETDYIKVSAKSGEGVEAMFESLVAKIIKKKKIENRAAVREDYTTNVVPLARNRSERECCNIC